MKTAAAAAIAAAVLAACDVSERQPPPQPAGCDAAIEACHCLGTAGSYALSTSGHDLVICRELETREDVWCWVDDRVLACFGCTPEQRIDDCFGR
jgi:hypothetical protein